MGVHTGDSITVAPAQTLSDVEYQAMRDDAFAVLRRVGVETGGSNVQFAVDPATGERLVIEMNPRVSRSSALASKATGFPIAKIAARLAVGYTLDEIRNDITEVTPASFEPVIDYVVTKIPALGLREAARASTARLGTRMQSVGEVMAIGRTFAESLQKAIRSLEQGRPGFALGRDQEFADLGDEELRARCVEATPERLFCVHEALWRGTPVDALAEAHGRRTRGSSIDSARSSTPSVRSSRDPRRATGTAPRGAGSSDSGSATPSWRRSAAPTSPTSRAGASRRA